MEILTPSSLEVSPALSDWCDRVKDTIDHLAAPVSDRDGRYTSLSAHIGNTPLCAAPNVPQTYLKYESVNLSGSHYGRAYLSTLHQLETEGLIRPGDELRDISSGSAAISLTVIGTALGYPVRLTVPSELPAARLFPNRYFGAELVDAGPGYIKAASIHQAAELKGLALDRNWKRLFPPDRNMRAIVFEHHDGRRVCYLNHSENTASPAAFSQIAHELVAQMIQPPTTLALAIGNWTTIAGITPVIRAAWPQTRIIGYQSPPTETFENYGTVSAAAEGTDVPVRFRDESLVDEIQTIGNEDRDAMGMRVNAYLPLPSQLGRSSLMGLVVAERAVRQHAGPAVSIAYDHAMRY